MGKSKEKILIVVESPAKGKKIQHLLPDDKEYIILASKGHIADLSKKGQYNLGVNIDKDYLPHFVISEDRISDLNAIIDSASIASKVLLATDPDREGEAIAYHLAERIKQACKKIKRIEFKEITKKGILDALHKEREIDDNLVQAAIARRVLDRIVGYLGSPFVIKQIGKGVSAGRVQSVALRLIVDREREIEVFKPEEYWNIKANLIKFADSPFIANLHQKADITNEQDATLIKKELEEATFTVTKVDAKPKKRYPLPPLDTAKLQMLADTRYNLTSSRTMDAAQKLYENGIITYMRTDSLRLSSEAITMARGWIQSNHPDCLPPKEVVYKNSDAAQDAHEAIRPTDISVLPKAKPIDDDEKVYKLIWDMFVACQMNPAIYDTTSVTITTDSKRILKCSGRVLKDMGWLVITGEIDEDKEDDNKLPDLSEKDLLSLVKPGVIAEQKFTQPPRRFKNATLIQELKDKKIGRPSTYESIMTKICDTRNFVTKDKKNLIPTKIGKDLSDLLTKYFTFMNIDYTSKLEEKLDKIAAGNCSYVDAMKDFFPPFKSELDKAYNESNKHTDYICTKCGAEMLLKRSTLGYFLGCSNYPKCKTTISCELIDDKIVQSTKQLEEAPKDTLCPTCGATMFIRNGKFGEFYSCSLYPNCHGSRKKPFGKQCPNCGKDLFRTVFYKLPHKGPVLCCTGYPKCNYVEDLEEENFEEKHKENLKEIRHNSKKMGKTAPDIL